MTTRATAAGYACLTADEFGWDTPPFRQAASRVGPGSQASRRQQQQLEAERRGHQRRSRLRQQSLHYSASLLVLDLFMCLLHTSLPTCLPTSGPTLALLTYPILPTCVWLTNLDHSACLGEVCKTCSSREIDDRIGALATRRSNDGWVVKSVFRQPSLVAANVKAWLALLRENRRPVYAVQCPTLSSFPRKPARVIRNRPQHVVAVRPSKKVAEP